MKLDALEQSHARITELGTVLRALIPNEAVCQSSLTCELFLRFVGEVKRHFRLQEQVLFPCLLRHREPRYNRAANRVIQANQAVKRIFTDYLNTWCVDGALTPGEDREGLVRDTVELFRLVQGRIDEDARQLYPLARTALHGAPVRLDGGHKASPSRPAARKARPDPLGVISQ